MYDYLIVGAGLYGSVIAYRLKRMGKSCLVIDKRKHTGGNIHCENVCGINVHKYGAHIFHTNNEEVWNFVNSIVPFNHFVNSPIANYKGELYNLPFNMNTFHQMWGVNTPEEAKAKIDEQKYTGEIHNLEEQALSLVGKDIYEKLIKGYTEKQWGRPCNALPAFIIRRLPLRFTFDNNYFNASYQGIPIGGYNRLIDGLLEGIDVKTDTDFFKHRDELQQISQKIVYTGPIDEYFQFCYGNLQYRSVSFKTEVLSQSNYQNNAVVNYTDSETPFTRIIEHKHFETFGDDIDKNPQTVVSREFSEEWHPGMEPYYPVNDETNTLLYNKYKDLADKEENVIFGGRLAEYKYYDMDKVIEQALSVEL